MQLNNRFNDDYRIIDLLIRLETNMARLYLCFADVCAKEKDFWFQLSTEEVRHASLLRTHREYIVDSRAFSGDLLSIEIMKIQYTNDRIEREIDMLDFGTMSLKQALTKAYEYETSAGECHFQKAVSFEDDQIARQILRRLNHEDKDHAERIQSRLIMLTTG